jgi:purine nucleosidase
MPRIIFVGICLLVMFLLSLETAVSDPDISSIKPKLILDADSANEIDDMYAIIRLLHQDQFELLGINSTQWLHYKGEPLSADASHRVNLDLLRLLGREDIPVFLGSNEPMGWPWGGDDPKDSAAVQFILDQVHKLAGEEVLTVVCIGATTNLASAIKMEPAIVSRIRVYVMGFQLDPETEIWNKSEFKNR